MQGLPDISELTTVTPSVEKLDIERLHRDIPKYYPFLKAESTPVWNDFLKQQLPRLTSTSYNSTNYQDQFRQLIAAGNRRVTSSSHDHEKSMMVVPNQKEKQ